MMSNIHTVVVVNGSQLGQFLKVLPSTGGGVEKIKKSPVIEVGVDKISTLNYF